MFYTVISKSGWDTDYWRVRKTFMDKSKAEAYAKRIKTSDPKQNGYNVNIKAHRKTLSQIADDQMDTVTFSDRTRAYWPS